MSGSVLPLIGVACFGLTVLAQNPSAPTTTVPDVVVRSKCVTCHTVDLIQQQRLSRAGWEREVDKMIRWGALVTDADRAPLLDFVETIARPSPAQAPVAGGRGAEVFTQQCVGCHALDMVQQQRLGTAAWRREVDKMAGWGARVGPEDKDPLVTYLAAHSGVQ